MAQLTQTQRAEFSEQPLFRGRVRAWLINRANFWKDSSAATRADVTKRFQKRKRLAEKLLTEHGFIDTLLVKFGEYFLAQYSTDPAAVETIEVSGGDPYQTLAESALDTAAFNAAYDFYAQVEPGDDTDQELDW